MASFTPRAPYTEDELKRLYPENLQLHLVQVLLRHGERTPVSSRFQNAGLPPYWSYCSAARQLRSVILSQGDQSQWSSLKYRRRLETFGPHDDPLIASGPKGEYDGICNPGELTDRGRQTTLALGQRLRHLYVDQLKFMPRLIADADMIYLRSTPVPRALESVQQAFWGLYPQSARTADFPPPTIITRSPADETLYPNDGNCRRFAQLGREFAQRTADRWNDSADMEYLNRVIGKWMPASSPRIAVDSHPRLTGIMDTVNATKAHGPATKLPKEFYDEKADAIIDRISVEEWYSGYAESHEYRMLGIGSLMGDIVGRMMGSVEHHGDDGLQEIGGDDGDLGHGRGGETSIKFGLSGCHDTTLAALLTSLGAFDGERWPPFTSSIAFELFRKKQATGSSMPNDTKGKITASNDTLNMRKRPQSWWASIFSSSQVPVNSASETAAAARRALDELSDADRHNLDDFFVRIRYNDRVMQVPACTKAGNHLDGDETFCTLEAFKAVVDKYTPAHWKQACNENLDKPAFPSEVQPAGH